MGNIFSWKSQPRELRIIYVEDEKERIFPIFWPASFAQFILEISNLFPYLRNPRQFIFKDGTNFNVWVCNESTFQALVPKHKSIAPTVDLYYVCLEKITPSLV